MKDSFGSLFQRVQTIMTGKVQWICLHHGQTGGRENEYRERLGQVITPKDTPSMNYLTSPTSYLPPPPIMPSYYECINESIHPLSHSPHDLWNGHHRHPQRSAFLI
jgi:hypothetical protein